MKRFLLFFILTTTLMSGCGFVNGAEQEEAAPQANVGGGTNVFNPYMNSKLPNLRATSAETEQMLAAMGAKTQSIEGEAAHRKNWREEIYPVVFGRKDAPNEIIAVLDFSAPASAEVWQQVVEASKSLSPQQCKIVVFGKSKENYGTDLMGLAIWISHERNGQAMQFLSYALKRWNEVKAAQNKEGRPKKFTNEYDAVASPKEYPIHYAYFSRLNPPVPASQELAVAKYCYNAGNVNMFQANQVCQYYGISSLPAVIADGKVLKSPTAKSILAAVK